MEAYIHEYKCKNAQFLGGTFPSGSLPLVESRNLIADLSLISQASSINNPDTSERRTPKSAARAYRPCFSLALDGPA